MRRPTGLQIGQSDRFTFCNSETFKHRVDGVRRSLAQMPTTRPDRVSNRTGVKTTE
jgi:hypothetical protein